MIDVVTAKRLAEKYKILYSKTISLSENLSGYTPPSNLVTELTYPKVYLGLLFTENEKSDLFDNPEILSENKVSIEDLIEFRTSMINARKAVDVNIPKKNDKIYEKVLEASLSIKSVNVELFLNKIRENTKLTKIIAYYGFNGYLKDLKINENPKIPNVIYNINDVKAEDGVYLMYEKGLSDYYISRIFSLGFFGLKTNRKLVPSKWSITAVHSILYRKIISENKDKLKSISTIMLFNYKLYGNDFYGLFLPGNGNVELIEVLLPGCVYNLNGKNSIIGRDDESGGYYALKLSFAEFQNYSKYKGDLVVIRIINRDYKIPLGVWVVREGTKRMFRNLIERFNGTKEALEYLNNLLGNRYNLNIYKIKKYSNILNQKKLLFI